MASLVRHLVVIPAFNEENCLRGTIQGLQCLPGDFDLLVINDGSTDNTSQLARELAATSRLRLDVIDLPMNCGIGVTVQTGYLYAAAHGGYRYVIQFDADGQHDATAIEPLIQQCEDRQLDFCVGSRFLSASGPSYESTFARRTGIRLLAALISSLSLTRVTDPTSGFRCAGPRAWQEFAKRYPDDYPEPESMYWCLRNRLRIREIPVRMFPRAHGSSSIQSWDSIYYLLKVTLAILIEALRKEDRASR